MKKIFVSLMVMTIAMSAFAAGGNVLGTATAGAEYWGTGDPYYKAYGLEDGTVAIYAIYLSAATTEITVPDVIYTNTTDEHEDYIYYEVSQIGYSNWGVAWIDLSGANQLTSLTSVTLAEGVKRVNDGAFYGATALTTLNLPASSESIGDYAFDGATALTTINFAGSEAPAISGGHEFSWSLIENKSCYIYCKDATTVETFNQNPWTYWTEFYNAGLVKVKGGTTAIDNTEASVKARKIIRDGQVLVERNGEFYNLTGAIVK